MEGKHDINSQIKEYKKEAQAFAYKKVANRVKPVATTLPEKFRIVRRIPSDPLAELPRLPVNPPDYKPGKRYTQERKDLMPVNKNNFLWPEEEKLIHHLILIHETAFAWDETEKGKFRDEYFDPVVIPTIEHIPWIESSIPIPPGIRDKVIKAIKHKVDSKVFEESNSSYRSKLWFVPKKDKDAIRLVHDLQPLNAVVIKDSAGIPKVEEYAESFGGRGCYAMFDLFVGFDQRALAPESRDLTTFQTPLGAKRMTVIPMGYTNSVQIYHGDTTFILQKEIPHVTEPFIDDIPVKGPTTRYLLEDGTYETIPENSKIRRFVWEHLQNVNRVIQRIKHAGGTISGYKAHFCDEFADIVGHRCTQEGRVPEESRVQKILDWPIPINLTEVRGFLGTMGTIRVFIQNYAMHAKPLVELTKKNIEFEIGADQLLAIETLKHLANNCPAIKAIDYASENEVILAVDSSWMAVGYWLSQIGDDKKRYPSRYGSITWNEREQRYSQAKLELFGLFRALKAIKLYIVGVRNLIVEVDVKYIKGMINNPDVQPNAAMNRWIAGILLFQFKLRHVPAKDHTAADGLSRRPKAPEDKDDLDDPEEWIDTAYSFAIECLNFEAASAKRNSSEGKQNIASNIYLKYPKTPKFNSSRYKSPSIFINQILFNDVEIPRKEKFKAKDKKLELVKQFLEDPTMETNLSDEELKQFIKYAIQFFILDDQLWKKNSDGKHKLVVPEAKRLELIKQAHDDLGHKGIFTVRIRLMERFWWPHLLEDVKWYIKTCHECQTRLLQKNIIPASVPTPFGLFRKIYMDTMLMPKAKGYRYILHGRCSLSSYPEWSMVKTENFKAIATFIHQILCRWGAIEEIVTDNAPQYIQAAKYLADKFHIHHIRISPYNSRAQGPIERKHYDVRESIIKATDGDESKWPEVAPSIFWAERITIQKSTGYSPYYIAHGVEPLLPFDLAEATYLAPNFDKPITTEELIAARAKMLMKRPADLQRVREQVLKARWEAVKALEKKSANKIVNYDFKPGTLVLVRNSRFDKTVTGAKTKPRYFGPMIVIRHTKGNSYVLGELDGSVSKLRFAAFRLIPYYPRDIRAVPVTKIDEAETEALEEITHDSENQFDQEDFDSEDN